MMRHTARRLIIHQWPHIVLALRGTAAALAALAAAVFLKLECPYWAAMTALIVIQPTRGLLLEKSFYRLLGTAVGSLAGFMLLLSTRSPSVLAIVLSLWIAACVGIGNLLYGLRSYAFLMAGCTGVIIAMSAYQNPPHLYDIVFGRIACITVGIVVSTTVTALFTPRQSRRELLDRVIRVAGESVRWLALLLSPGREGKPVSLEQDILIEIAEVEELVDVVGAGSFRFKKQKRHIRSFMVSLLSLLAVGRLAREQLARYKEEDRRSSYWQDQLARKLEEVADKLENSRSINCTAEMEAIAAEAKKHLPLLGETLHDIITSLQRVLEYCNTMTGSPSEEQINRFVRHRDWQEAGRAALRAALAIAAVGVTWAATGWTKGPLMLMAMSIMLSVFSAKEHPAHFVGQIFVGAAIGSATAVLCRIALLSGVGNPFVAIAIIAPFILLGVFAMSQRRTAIAATDATLFFLFVTQPGMSITILPADLVLGAIAMVMGVGSAWLAYRFLIPINPAIRMRSLMASIMREVERLAVADSSVVVEKLSARLHHRVLRLVAMATRNDADHRTVVEGGIAALAVAGSIQRLREMLSSGNLPPRKAGIIRETLAALSDLRQRPGNAALVLEHAANTLYAVLGSGFEEPGSSQVTNGAAGFFEARKVCWRRGGCSALSEIQGI